MKLIKEFLARKNVSKLITIILIGILLLVVVMPFESCSDKKSKEAGNDAGGLYGTGTGSLYGSNNNEESLFSGNGASDTNSNNTSGITQNGSEMENSICKYYEDELKRILEKSYGEGTIDVMVHMKEEKTSELYGSSNQEQIVDGVIVVVNTHDAAIISEISRAVCSVFNLPACKVAVLARVR